VKCDRRELFELTEFIALQFSTACPPDQNAVNMLWQSVDIDEKHFYHSTLNVFMPYVLILQENSEFLKETIVLLMDSAQLTCPKLSGD
jgi:hypothetical protein